MTSAPGRPLIGCRGGGVSVVGARRREFVGTTCGGCAAQRGHLAECDPNRPYQGPPGTRNVCGVRGQCGGTTLGTAARLSSSSLAVSLRCSLRGLPSPPAPQGHHRLFLFPVKPLGSRWTIIYLLINVVLWEEGKGRPPEKSFVG